MALEGIGAHDIPQRSDVGKTVVCSKWKPLEDITQQQQCCTARALHQVSLVGRWWILVIHCSALHQLEHQHQVALVTRVPNTAPLHSGLPSAKPFGKLLILTALCPLLLLLHFRRLALIY